VYEPTPYITEEVRYCVNIISTMKKEAVRSSETRYTYLRGIRTSIIKGAKDKRVDDYICN